MKEVIHRLLLFIVWGCTALFCFLVYDGFKRDDETVVENPINNANARGSASDDSSGGFESVDIAST